MSDSSTSGAENYYANHVRVDAHLAGSRLDIAAVHYFSDFSRSKLQYWIKLGYLLVNGQKFPPKHPVQTNDLIALNAPLTDAVDWSASPAHATKPTELIYEDAHILVVNKPADLVVHPAAGHQDDTLVNALLLEYPGLREIPRAGIVHRLDKDTTGLMVVARTLKAHQVLVAQLAERQVKRKYEAIVQGMPIAGGTIDAPIARHPKNRLKMCVRQSPAAKEARTHWRIAQRFSGFALLNLQLDTGRTHQIRVHLSHRGFPILGDPLYGARLQLPKGGSEELARCLRGFKRQALHAKHLGLSHPETGDWLEWTAPLPADFAACVTALTLDGAR